MARNPAPTNKAPHIHRLKAHFFRTPYVRIVISATQPNSRSLPVSIAGILLFRHVQQPKDPRRMWENKRRANVDVDGITSSARKERNRDDGVAPVHKEKVIFGLDPRTRFIAYVMSIFDLPLLREFSR